MYNHSIKVYDSRFDAYLTNMIMSWEKEAPPTLLSVSCLECWVKANDENKFKYERVWNKTYPSYANCIYGSNNIKFIIRVIFSSRNIFFKS